MSAAYAFIFPGQGAQYVGMGRDLFRDHETARRIFEQADSILDGRISSACFQGPAELLRQSSMCQPAIVTVSAALNAVLQERGMVTGAPAVCAGLSLGEYSALVACGSLSLPDALRLVRHRGALMDEASRAHPGAMACLLGIEEEAARRVCEQSGAEIANLNSPGQVVISGTHAAIERASVLAQQAGAKRVIGLDVSGPFHCSLMQSAADGLAAALQTVNIAAPQTGFIPNVTAALEKDPAAIKSLLVRQVSHATYWEKSVRVMLQMGIQTFYEIGPGKVLRGLMQRIDKNARVINIESVDDLAGK